MEKLSVNYRDNTFGPDIADECVLRAVIGADGLALSVRRKYGKTQLLQTWAYAADQSENALRRILNKTEMPAWPFESVELLYFTPIATIAPKRMFDPTLAGDYLHTLKENLNGKAEYEALPNMDMTAIWANDTRLTTIGDYFFPKAKPLAYTVGLLEAFQKFSDKNDVAVCVHFRPSHIQLAAFERGSLLFFNTFLYEKPSDVLYFTLLVYDQFHLKPTDAPLFISGELLPDAEIYRQYERFIKNIRFLGASPLMGVPDSLAPHLYLDQTLFL